MANRNRAIVINGENLRNASVHKSTKTKASTPLTWPFERRPMGGRVIVVRLYFGDAQHFKVVLRTRPSRDCLINANSSLVCRRFL